MVFTYYIIWMIRQFFVRLGFQISNFVKHPLRVFLTCAIFVVAGLLLDGTMFRLWRLSRDTDELAARTVQMRIETTKLDHKILQSKDPNFLELEARERLDLASEGDLVFVFSDETNENGTAL